MSVIGLGNFGQPTNGRLGIGSAVLFPQTLNGRYNNVYGFSSNSTFVFNVNSLETQEPALGSGTGLSFTITTTGPTTVTFQTGLAPTVTCTCTSSLVGTNEKLVFSSGLSVSAFTIVWGLTPILTEPFKVLFLDNFLTGTVADQGWTIDLYSSPQSTTGGFTSGGYFAMQAKSTSAAESIHVSTPIFVPSQYAGQNIIVKRKTTFAMYPFARINPTITAYLHLGTSSLLSSGTYPGTSPANTPTISSNNGCNTSGTTDDIGGDYFYMTNTGYIEADTCGDPSGTHTFYPLETVDPTLYTVFTIESYGQFCSTCTDNVHPGIAWVWFRVYQENSQGLVISSSEKTLNATSNIAPYFNPQYIFVSQYNYDSAATNEVSYLNLVQSQNYGSPVCLFGCIPPINLIGLAPFSSIWASVVSLCQWMGLGDLSMGAFFLFTIVIGIVIGATFMVGVNYGSGAPTFVIVSEFIGISAIFLTSGLMGSVWLFAILICDVVVALFTFNYVFLGGGRGDATKF